MRHRHWIPVMTLLCAAAIAGCGSDSSDAAGGAAGGGGTGGTATGGTGGSATGGTGGTATGGTGGIQDVCGDGDTAGSEACDDGNKTAGDGCAADCTLETGWTCDGSPSVCAPKCGDGLLVGTEPCDDGNMSSDDGCSKDCAIEPGYECTGAPSTCTAICGDGVVTATEGCDDGNTASGDGCSSACEAETGYHCTGAPSTCVTTCGDGIQAGDEGCDDSNTAAADGCSDTCTVEAGYECTGAPSVCTPVCGDGEILGQEACDDGNTTSLDGCSAGCLVEAGFECTGTPSVCTTTCGDGIPAGAEGCDDGGTAGGDGCAADCTVETGWACAGTPSVCTSSCGDGIPAGAEECDDGDTVSGDGCAADCKLETGYSCTGTPSICSPSCGDNLITGSETCDDGNTTAGDGCSDTCAVEDGWSCTSTPSVCTSTCGDSKPVGTETCDDGNTVDGDGCASDCKTEHGYTCTGTPSVCDTTCGDGVIAGTEACDDGNTNDNDCCSSTCQLEAGCEVEPNDTRATANDFAALAVADKVKAFIRPDTDLDVFSIVVPPNTTGTITATTLDGFLGTTCASNDLDNYLTIYDSQGTALETDDDDGEGYCALAIAPNLTPGTYYVESKRSSLASASTFDYTLQIGLQLAVCGDGTLNAGEQCDDGNTADGDGCSSLCKLEATGETEPNDTCATASSPITLDDTGATKLMSGAISPAADADWWAFTILSFADVKFETFDQNGPSTCATIDTVMQLYASNCTTMLGSDDDDGVGFCSKIDPTGDAFSRHLAPGTYYLNVKALSSSSTFPYTLQATLTAMCGNGIKEGSEECDGGPICAADCTLIPVCGDGVKSAAEQCDDGNTIDGDGCSATCTLELKPETEPNNTCASSNGPYTLDSLTGYTIVSGDVTPAGDIDWTSFTLTSYADVKFETFDQNGPGTCATIDTLIQLVGPDCSTVLGSDDEDGIGSCSKIDPATDAFARHLAPGTYHVSVKAFLSTATFAYQLQASLVALCGNGVKEGSEECDGGATCGADCTLLPVCGDGIVKSPEQCDDGNQVDSDGCSSTCKWELTTEVEPNDTTGEADTNASSNPDLLINGSRNITAAIGTSGDVDIFKVKVGTPTAVRFEVFDPSGTDCSSSSMSAMTLTLLSGSGTTLYTESSSAGIGVCPALVVYLDAGDYYVQASKSTSGTIAGYFLQVKFETDAGNEAEPNDSQATASTLPGSDTYVWGGHQVGTDVDVYAVTVTAGRSIRAEVIEGGSETCESNGIDSHLTLYSPAYVSLGTDDDDGRGYCSKIDGTGTTSVDSFAHNLAAGTYYLVVNKSSLASGADGEFDYRLVVTVR